MNSSEPGIYPVHMDPVIIKKSFSLLDGAQEALPAYGTTGICMFAFLTDKLGSTSGMAGKSTNLNVNIPVYAHTFT